jgi:hypothetical protein
MSGVPNVFGSATSSIPLSQLDVNFNTPLYIGNTSVGLGNTVTSFGNVTLTNTTITVGNVTTDLTIHGLTVGLGSGSQSQNTVVGASALALNTSGANNTAVGYQTLYNNTASNNTALGYQAGKGISGSVSDNIAIGVNALNTPLTGGPSIAIGSSALSNASSGGNNVAVGHQALQANSSASNNTAVGYQAGYSNTGEGNTYLGWQAGYATTGIGNVLIGRGTSTASAGDNYEIVIGYATSGKGSSTAFIQCNGGGAYQSNNSTTWSFTSDQRLKKNIVTNTDGLNKISQLTVRNFEYRLPEEVDPELKPTDALNIPGVQLGFIAQELQQVFPDCVKTESTGVMGVNIDNVIYHMVNAIKDLNALVTAQATEIEALKAKVGI